MSLNLINSINFYVSYATPYVVLVIGNIGCLCNFLTFTAKKLRVNSCGWYFLMSALFDFIYINFGLFTKLANEQFGSTLQNTNLAWCRIRVFLTWALPCFATGYLVLASLDRCFSTLRNVRFRSFSQPKIAYWMSLLPIVINSLTTSHQFFYYDLRPSCAPLPGTYAYFLSMYSIIWTSLIPQTSMLVFGLITYFNIRKSRQRLTRNAEQQLNRTDAQLVTITLVQVLFSSILLNIRTTYYSYTVLSTNLSKDAYRRAVESLCLQISSFLFYFNFSKSFFVNTLTSKLFRKIFQQRFLFIYQRLICGKIHVQPFGNTQSITVTVRKPVTTLRY